MHYSFRKKWKQVVTTFNRLSAKVVLRMFSMGNNPDSIFIFRMYGLFQTTFYFGYMALFSLGLGIMCGKSCTRVAINWPFWFCLLLCFIMSPVAKRTLIYFTKTSFPCDWMPRVNVRHNMWLRVGRSLPWLCSQGRWMVVVFVVVRIF